MMYRCKDCGNVFPDPVIRDSWEHRPDGALEPMRYVYCPWCGGADFEEEKEEDDG